MTKGANTGSLGQLLACGRHEALSVSDTMPWRTWHLYVLVLATAGAARYQDDAGSSLDFLPGDLLVVCPDTRWRYVIDPEIPWSERWCTCSGPLFDCWLQAGLIGPDKPLFRLGQITAWSRRFAALDGAQGLDAVVAVQGLLARAIAHQRTGNLDPWFNQASTALDELPLGTGRWQQAARQLGLHPERFRKRFAIVAGCGPAAWLDRRRMEEARTRLETTADTLVEIAEALDFCDVHHFARRFRQAVGMPPGQWRQLCHR